MEIKGLLGKGGEVTLRRGQSVQFSGYHSYYASCQFCMRSGEEGIRACTYLRQLAQWIVQASHIQEA